MENFEKYKEYTKAANWAEIGKLNDVNLDSFGTKKELKALPQYLEADEVVFALTSGIMSQTATSNSFDFGTNTWLVVLTSDRFLFLDAAMLSSSVDTQSIRHNHVQAVSASQGLVLGKIMVDLGSRTLIIDNCQKATVKVMANLANKWIKELSENRANAAGVMATPSQTPLLDLLERLDKLFSLGAMSEKEFNEARSRLLDSSKFKTEKAKFLASIP
ncbi:PH domain-containing protein [Rheinheimera aquimaris]|uniref:PH domain-containing protein n=1 Tax=Rheinheimera aquimaris TaxID=412437 RepID=UPI001E369C29|nr:PH domain-containing protein [Rheinheimera aquimaris]MCD1598275.1 PH domain-containing protein [Rheinheimera aquimaris]